MNRALLFSMAVHVALFLFLTLRWAPAPRDESRVAVDLTVNVVDLTKKNPSRTAIVPHQVIKKPSQKAAPPTAGLTRESMTDSSNASAKIGNTLSKAPDNLPSNEGPLPPPADDFAITAWPKLQNDVRVPYPAEARRLEISGVVVMDLYVDESGHVRQAKLVKGPGHGLDEAGIAAARQFVFTPARAGDKIVPVIIRYSYKFVVQH